MVQFVRCRKSAAPVVQHTPRFRRNLRAHAARLGHKPDLQTVALRRPPSDVRFTAQLLSCGPRMLPSSPTVWASIADGKSGSLFEPLCVETSLSLCRTPHRSWDTVRATTFPLQEALAAYCVFRIQSDES